MSEVKEETATSHTIFTFKLHPDIAAKLCLNMGVLVPFAFQVSF